MKKKLKLSMIIVGSAVAAVAVCALILGLIPINPIKRLPDNYTVTVSNTTYDQLPLSDEAKATLEKGIAGNKFSVLHALLEYKYSYSFRFRTFKNDDGDKERYKYYAKEIKAVAATSSAYLLTLNYDEIQHVKVKGETLEFDRVKFLVRDMQGEIERVEMIFYLNDKIGGEPGDEYYYVNPVEVHMASSKLYDAVKEIEEGL